MEIKLTKNQIGAGILLPITAMLGALFGLYIGRIVDAVSKGDFQIFIQRLIITGIILVINTILSIFARRFLYTDSGQRAEKLKYKVYDYELQKERSQDIDIAKFSSKMDLLYNDNYLTRWLIYENFLLFIFSGIAIIFINWVMFLVAILASIIPMLIPTLLEKYVQREAKEYAKESTSYLDYISDTLEGRLEIKKYNVTEAFRRKHSVKNSNFESKRLNAKIANYRARNITGMFGNISILALFFVGGILTFMGYMEVGGVVGVIQLMNNVVRPIVEIASFRNEMNATKPILEELNEDAEHDMEDKTTFNGENAILLSIENLSYKYPQAEDYTIKNFTYTFEFGKKYLINGASGSGKSTLAKLLSGELLSANGMIQLNEERIESLETSFLSGIISYVDQKSYIFKESVYNNIDLYRAMDKTKIMSLIDILRINSLNAEDIIDDNNGISGGEKSRICLARAALNLPKILIIDEPTAALDSENALNIMKFLCSLPITVIAISHSEDEKITQLFDNIINATALKT